jgi:hypothetical protein
MNVLHQGLAARVSAPAAMPPALAVALGSNPMQIVRKPRSRNESTCLDSAYSVDEAAVYLNQMDARKMFKPKPSGGVDLATDRNNNNLFQFDLGQMNLNSNDSDDEEDSFDDTLRFQKKSPTPEEIEAESNLGLVSYKLNFTKSRTNYLWANGKSKQKSPKSKVKSGKSKHKIGEIQTIDAFLFGFCLVFPIFMFGFPGFFQKSRKSKQNILFIVWISQIFCFKFPDFVWISPFYFMFGFGRF